MRRLSGSPTPVNRRFFQTFSMQDQQARTLLRVPGSRRCTYAVLVLSSPWMWSRSARRGLLAALKLADKRSTYDSSTARYL